MALFSSYGSKYSCVL
uniref:Uncharacterized protein n=1 Tax=Arundo donax TaxID=35708 RepID=A0A0A9BQQ5_ARUDO